MKVRFYVINKSEHVDIFERGAIPNPPEYVEMDSVPRVGDTVILPMRPGDTQGGVTQPLPVTKVVWWPFSDGERWNVTVVIETWHHGASL
jgi:hypothetical protein